MALGLGIVFFGLVCIIIISSVMSAIVRLIERKTGKNGAPEDKSPGQNAVMTPEEKGRFVAAVSCAIAEELGTGVDAIRIRSIKKI